MSDRPRVDPEKVRAARPGEAWVIHAGRAMHLRVLQPPRPPATNRPAVDLEAAQPNQMSDTPRADERATQPAADASHPRQQAECTPISGRRRRPSSGPRILGRLLHRWHHQANNTEHTER